MPAAKKNESMSFKPYKIKKFRALDSNAKSLSEKDVFGHWSVIYFYPKDMTSGCTIESNDFEKKLKNFKEFDCHIYGVSKDSCQSHLKFAEKESLTFTLISDDKGEMSEAFGVWKEKSMYGKKYMGIERSTFLINPDGLVVYEWRKVKVSEHVNQVLKIFKSML